MVNGGGGTKEHFQNSSLISNIGGLGENEVAGTLSEKEAIPPREGCQSDGPVPSSISSFRKKKYLGEGPLRHGRQRYQSLAL